MPAISLAEAQAQLAAWLAASRAVAASQSYEIAVSGSSRKLTRADGAEIRAQIEFWRGEVARLDPAQGRTRARGVVFG